jgi:hypothetical protein
MSKPRKTTKNRKPRVDELIAARNPLERLKVKPVDLYPVTPTREADGAPARPGPKTTTTPRERTGHGGSQNEEAAPSPSETPTSRTPSSSTSLAAAEDTNDAVVPYGTYIRSSQRTGIKLRAAVTGRDAYEIVQAAIDEYFENHPVNL